MAAGRHIENRFLGIMSTIYCPINAKFGTKKQAQVTLRSHDQNAKFRKFKMADGRHFENGLITISQPIIIRFQNGGRPPSSIFEIWHFGHMTCV